MKKVQLLLAMIIVIHIFNTLVELCGIVVLLLDIRPVGVDAINQIHNYCVLL